LQDSGQLLSGWVPHLCPHMLTDLRPSASGTGLRVHRIE
jgi:hypothetical protein